MDKFEYKTEKDKEFFTFYKYIDWLNDEGKYGWELIQSKVKEIDMGFGPLKYSVSSIVFKRKVLDISQKSLTEDEAETLATNGLINLFGDVYNKKEEYKYFFGYYSILIDDSKEISQSLKDLSKDVIKHGIVDFNIACEIIPKHLLNINLLKTIFEIE